MGSKTPAKVAETLVETCFFQDGLKRFKPRFKPVLAETCQHWFWRDLGGWMQYRLSISTS